MVQSHRIALYAAHAHRQQPPRACILGARPRRMGTHSACIRYDGKLRLVNSSLCCISAASHYSVLSLLLRVMRIEQRGGPMVQLSKLHDRGFAMMCVMYSCGISVVRSTCGALSRPKYGTVGIYHRWVDRTLTIFQRPAAQPTASLPDVRVAHSWI